MTTRVRNPNPPSWRDRPASMRPGISQEWIDEQKRLRITRAVATVIAEKGYEGASVREIVKAGACARKTFYELFPNREGVFEYAITLAVREAKEAALKAEEEHGGLAAVAAVAHWVMQNRDLAFAALVEGPKLGRYGDEFEAIVAGLEVERPLADLLVGALESQLRSMLRSGSRIDTSALVKIVEPYLGA